MDEMVQTNLNTEIINIKERLAAFQKAVESMIGTNANAYVSRPSTSDPVNDAYTIADIQDIIQGGDPTTMIALSNYFLRYSGTYNRIIDYYSNLLLYYSIVSPKLGESTMAKNKIKAKFNKALEFVDNLQLDVNLSRVVKKILSEGAYYGLLREYSESVTLQDQPLEFCRTRYKNEFGIDILEFNLKYFDNIRDPIEKESAQKNFPPEIVKAYKAYLGAGKKSQRTEWFVVPAYLGAAFYYHDFIPFFISILPTLVRYDESQDREADRDEEELQRILINEMPLDKDGEPVFLLEETAIIHNGITNMLRNNKYLEVLTTFGKVHMEQAQNSKSAANQDNTAKFESAIFDSAGVSSEQFNATGNTAQQMSIEKDTSFVISLTSQIMEWITFQLNYRLGDNKMKFDVQILPVTIHNKKEMAGLYLSGAQYGYSKFYAGVALGIKQSNLISLVTVENDIFDLGSKMVPLQSSHTQSLDGKSKDTNPTGDNKSGPGRPEQDDTEKSDKTIANENSE